MSCSSSDEMAIRVQGVSFSYGKRKVLDEVSLEVAPGSFSALIGPNGAGKSTLLRLLLGVLRPTSGEIAILGRPPGEQGQPIGYVPQGINLPKGFPLSVTDVVLMGRYGNLGPFKWPGGEDRKRTKGALESVGMLHLRDRRFQDLSGGQQQRVLIARALVGDPCLLILDEPTAGLDPAARARFYGQICDLQRARGLTLFCASHDVEDVAQHAQTLIVLDHSVTAVGPPQEVLKSRAVLETYHFPPPHVHGATHSDGNHSDGDHPHGDPSATEGSQ
jgi:manganese/zinc/iron transport system ATP- binding protein